MPEILLLVVLGCDLGWVVGPSFSSVMGWDGFGQRKWTTGTRLSRTFCPELMTVRYSLTLSVSTSRRVECVRMS